MAGWGQGHAAVEARGQLEKLVTGESCKLEAAVGLQEMLLQKQERGRHRSRSLKCPEIKLQQAWGIIYGEIAFTFTATHLQGLSQPAMVNRREADIDLVLSNVQKSSYSRHGAS